jgi:hypothetical protein
MFGLCIYIAIIRLNIGPWIRKLLNIYFMYLYMFLLFNCALMYKRDCPNSFIVLYFILSYSESYIYPDDDYIHIAETCNCLYTCDKSCMILLLFSVMTVYTVYVCYCINSCITTITAATAITTYCCCCCNCYHYCYC